MNSLTFNITWQRSFQSPTFWAIVSDLMFCRLPEFSESTFGVVHFGSPEASGKCLPIDSVDPRSISGSDMNNFSAQSWLVQSQMDRSSESAPGRDVGKIPATNAVKWNRHVKRYQHRRQKVSSNLDVQAPQSCPVHRTIATGSTRPYMNGVKCKVTLGPPTFRSIGPKTARRWHLESIFACNLRTGIRCKPIFCGSISVALGLACWTCDKSAT